MPRPESASSSLELPPFWRAAHYPTERASRLVYVQSQYFLMTERGLDLTVSRLLLDSGYHVAILGQQPPSPLDRAIGMLLESGTAARLSPTLLGELWRYHQTQDSIRPWLLRTITTR
ncbi:MAG: hypothetical protein ACKVVP_13130 [Chloroflexota bacterium]